MPASLLSVLSQDSLQQFPDLQSLPRYRRLGQHPVIERLRAAVPFDYIAIAGLDVDRYRFGEETPFDTDLPPAYVETCAAEQLHLEDPFFEASLNARTVISDTEVYRTAPPPERLAYLMRTFGVHNRTIIPILRNETLYGAVWLSRREPFDAEELDFLCLVAEAIHTAMTKPIMDRFAAEEMKLSKGEIACLTFASRGQKSDEIAANAGYQVDTVNSYLKSAIKKLGAANRTEAIAESIRRRIIA